MSHGGTLCLTRSNIRFSPHRIDRILSRKDWGTVLPLSDLESLGRTPKSGPPPKREFLRIDCRDGRVYLFLLSPRYLQSFIDEVARLAPDVRLVHGWGSVNG